MHKQHSLQSLQKALGFSHHKIDAPPAATGDGTLNRNESLNASQPSTQKNMLIGKKSTFNSKYTIQHLIEMHSEASKKTALPQTANHQRDTRNTDAQYLINKAQPLNVLFDFPAHSGAGVLSGSQRAAEYKGSSSINRERLNDLVNGVTAASKRRKNHDKLSLKVSRIQYYANVNKTTSAAANQYTQNRLRTQSQQSTRPRYKLMSRKRKHMNGRMNGSPLSEFNNVDAPIEAHHFRSNDELSSPTEIASRSREELLNFSTADSAYSSSSQQSHIVQPSSERQAEHHVQNIRNLQRKKISRNNGGDSRRIHHNTEQISQELKTESNTHPPSSSESPTQSNLIVQPPKFEPIKDPTLNRISTSLNSKMDKIQTHLHSLPNELEQNRIEHMNEVAQNFARRTSFEKRQQQADTDLQQIMNQLNNLEEKQKKHQELIGEGGRRSPVKRQPVKVNQVDLTNAKLYSSIGKRPKKKKKKKAKPPTILHNTSAVPRPRPGTSLGVRSQNSVNNRIMLTLSDRERVVDSTLDKSTHHSEDSLDSRVLDTSFRSVRVRSALSEHPRFTRRVRTNPKSSKSLQIASASKSSSSDIPEGDSTPRSHSAATWHSSLRANILDDLPHEQSTSPISRSTIRRPNTSQGSRRFQSQFDTSGELSERSSSAMSTRNNPFKMDATDDEATKSILNTLPSRGIGNIIYYNGSPQGADPDRIDPERISNILKDIIGESSAKEAMRKTKTRMTRKKNTPPTTKKRKTKKQVKKKRAVTPHIEITLPQQNSGTLGAWNHSTVDSPSPLRGESGWSPSS